VLSLGRVRRIITSRLLARVSQLGLACRAVLARGDVLGPRPVLPCPATAQAGDALAYLAPAGLQPSSFPYLGLRLAHVQLTCSFLLLRHRVFDGRPSFPRRCSYLATAGRLPDPAPAAIRGGAGMR